MRPRRESSGNELGFAAKLHAADDGGEVDVAAALAGADEGALDLHRAGEDRGAGIGYAEAAIGVAMEAEVGGGVVADQAADDVRDFFGRGAAGGVANDNAADLLVGALRGHLVEIVEGAGAEIGIAGVAVFAAAAGGVHGVLEIDQDFEAVVLEAGDGV